ncbi:unnamed protein product [Rodentolepis nana]|uniref:E3 ubiquitin-protein ligase n=1 Tax=Rodentolepis nana TaxID=102285 RepID=A0A158QHS4_RODNA|nr:unnamed protein product [Rodentolepis nana]
MELFEMGIGLVRDESDFIKHVCHRFCVTPSDVHEKLTADCVAENFDSPLCRGIKSLFRYDCLCGSTENPSKLSNQYLFTKLFAHLIAGPMGIDELSRALKNFDYSDRCSLVWIGDYFAYRCRTCGLTPSMSLCGVCFNAGNHENHDFNKFKSTCGGACDCGDPSVIKPSGNCRFHGPDKVANRPCPPRKLIAALQFLLPSVIKALMYWFWDQCKSVEPSLNEHEAPMLFFLHRLHACGWFTQQLMVNAMIDPKLFTELITDCSATPAYRSYKASIATRHKTNAQGSERNLSIKELKHRTLLESFLYTIVKLRFPESLSTLLIGLLPISEFKKMFIDAYVDHYETIASTLMISSRVRNISPEVAMQLNNRIVHISVQLFSGVDHALRMVKEKRLHDIIVKWMKNMFTTSRTRLDDRGKMVVNCDGVLIQNNAFWPLTSDLSNIVSHKVVADVFVEDMNFLTSWTDILKLMQFMNCFSLKEGSHIEYETMACYHGLTMEIEVSIGIMWYLWEHYKSSTEKEHCLMYTRACVESLAHHLTYLGRLVPTATQWAHPIRGPLSLHLPLSRHAACFLSLAIFTHHTNLKDVMDPFLSRSPNALRRLMEELANVLLGCQEVIIGYWVRNGQSVRQLVTHYMHSQMCYSMIDLDIFLFQVCAALMHPVYILNSLVDQARLLQNFCFHRELLGLIKSPGSRPGVVVDRQPLAIEAWLTNLCWILDLRNNLGLSETGLIEKELICFLAHSTRKRSDLSSLLPDRCMPQNTDIIDECLNRVATYVAPSCDSASGSLISGSYSLKPELWDEKFDPVFFTLRMASKKEQTSAMEKYRPHCRQRTGIQNTSSFWPPYRLPLELSPDFADLENVLHSRHFHYLLFSLLSLFVYGDPLVPEESLVMVIHLLYRAVVAGGLLLTQGRDSNRLAVEIEPTMPCFDPIQCTEAVMAATNREAELEAMQFADADSDNEEVLEEFVEHDVTQDAYFEEMGEDELDETMEGNDPQAPSSRGTEAMEVEEPVISATSTSSLRRVNAFRLRKPSNIPLKWDLSIVACPFPIPTTLSTIFQNLPTWLGTTPQTVSPVELETKTSINGNEYKIPARNDSIVMVDSLLSLLVKSHARLFLNRASISTTDQQGQQSKAPSAQDTSFLQLPSISDEKKPSNCDLTARCMAVLNSTGLEETPDGTPRISSLARAIQADASDGTPDEKMVKVLAEMPPELRYFAVSPPAYKLPGDRSTKTTFEQPSTSMSDCKPSVDCGDGVFWIGRLLDKIVESSPECEEELRVYIERANDPFDLAKQPERTSSEEANSSLLPSNLQGNARTRAQRKRAASERRKKLMDMMASKQRAFAENFLKDMDMDKVDDETSENLTSQVECEYNCVICQTKPETPQPMVLLVMLCESGFIQEMRNYSNLPRLSNERMTYSRGYLCEDSCIPKPLPILPPELRPQSSDNESNLPNRQVQTSVDSDHLQTTSCGAAPSPSLLLITPPPAVRISDTIIIPSSAIPNVSTSNEPPRGDVLDPVVYVEKRRWWHLALPNELVVSLPLLRSGVILQTCGHAVHRDCFQNYRAQSMRHGGGAMSRWMASCPLCRRDVHFLLPLHADYEPDNPSYHTPPPPLSTPLHTSTPEVATSAPTEIAAVTTVPMEQSDLPVADTQPKTFISILRKRLEGLPPEPHSIWSNLIGGTEEDPQQRFRLVAGLISGVSEVAIILRSQFESELSVLMVYPNLYRNIARRCLFRETMNYLRHVYSSPSDILSLVDSLSPSSLPTAVPISSSNIPQNFAIFNDPVDVLMILLPHVWPDEEQFMALGSSCICLSYARALVGLILSQMPDGNPGTFAYGQRASIQCAQSRLKEVHLLFSYRLGKIQYTILAMASALEQLVERTPAATTTTSQQTKQNSSDFTTEPSASSSSPTLLPPSSPTLSCMSVLSDLDSAASLDVVQLTLDPQTASRRLQEHLISQILPTVRIFALCLARWRDGLKLHKDESFEPILSLSLPFVGILSDSKKTDLNGEYFVKEFLSLASFLRIGTPVPAMSVEQEDPLIGIGPLLPFVQAAAMRSGLTASLDGVTALNEILHGWISQLTANLSSEPNLAESAIQSSATSQHDGSATAQLPPSIPTPATARIYLRGMQQPLLSRPFRGSQMLSTLTGTSIPKRNFSLADWVKNLGPLMATGRQLYPPRLIRPPEAFDDLFNNLQVVSSAITKHPFQNNVLCLICGQLLCDICSPNLATLLFKVSTHNF